MVKLNDLNSTLIFLQIWFQALFTWLSYACYLSWFKFHLGPLRVCSGTLYIHWIGLRENLQETMVFPMVFTIYSWGFPVNFPLNQPSDTWCSQSRRSKLGRETRPIPSIHRIFPPGSQSGVIRFLRYDEGNPGTMHSTGVQPGWHLTPCPERGGEIAMETLQDYEMCHGENMDYDIYTIFSSIFIYFHLFSSIFIYFHLFSSIFIYFHLFSSIFIYFHLFSSIFIYFHLFSSIFIYFHLFSSIFIYFHLFSSIFIYFHLFSSISLIFTQTYMGRSPILL